MLLKTLKKELEMAQAEGSFQQAEVSKPLYPSHSTSWKFQAKDTGHLFLWFSNLTPNSCHASWRDSRRERPKQNCTPGGQDCKTAGMCLVKTWGCLGSWKSPQGNSAATTAFPQLRVMNLKINLSDMHALRIIWEGMLLNPTTICPTGADHREGKRNERPCCLSIVVKWDKDTRKIQHWLP